MDTESKDLVILEKIYKTTPQIRQRDLAEIAGLSLGMTNAIVKRLAGKGLLTIKRVNNRNIHYIVTPKGIEEITLRSYLYFKKTIKNVVYYKESIEELVIDIKNQGYEGLILKGSSDLDFIVEHSCRKNGLIYIKNDKFNDNIFLLYSENYIPDKDESNNNCAFLQSILV
ncbi:MAG: winged helix-turn-helix transcriptional regulator [Spirochaetales bacterium]|nr:winged helix-turn-helix transcriptional regulator [Spirochaetales bacterium]